MSVLEKVIGLLAPPDCIVCGDEGSLLCRRCSADSIKPFGERCWRCNSLSAGSKTCAKCRTFGPLGHVWISTNYESTAQNLVRKYKFGHSRSAAEPLALMMSKNLSSTAQSTEMLVVHVPTATSRIRERGFDHSQLLAKTIAANLRLEYSNSLRRLDQTRQLGSKREDRLTQLSNSFDVKNNIVIGRNILLIDDVLTTGGTLIAAAKVLTTSGAKQVNALVFAKRL